jgi:hypothetical protein
VKTNQNKSKIILLSILAFAVIAFLIFSINRKNENLPHSEGFRNISVEAYQTPTGWAYRIYQDKKPVIEQTNIPGISGTNGFASQQEALKTGELVKQKLEQGIFPPTITRSELDSLMIKY